MPKRCSVSFFPRPEHWESGSSLSPARSEIWRVKRRFLQMAVSLTGLLTETAKRSRDSGSALMRKHYHPQKKMEAQKICRRLRIIFFKIPLCLWLGLLFVIFCVTDFKILMPVILNNTPLAIQSKRASTRICILISASLSERTHILPNLRIGYKNPVRRFFL